mgnify:CR=1 FL=1|jgi:hypothetical protein
MSEDWAEENLKTIRTLMERASLYRLSLAPISIIVGILGVLAAAIADGLHWGGESSFAGYWMAVGIIIGGITLVLIRRQALKAGEEFMSPAAKRVAQSMAPLFVAGLGFGVLELVLPITERDSIRLAGLWMISYGGGIHAAGFFMRRGLKLLGCLFLALGLICLACNYSANIPWLNGSTAHWVMGGVFGMGNLLYGIYLKVTAEPLNAE